MLRNLHALKAKPRSELVDVPGAKHGLFEERDRYLDVAVTRLKDSFRL